MIGTQLVLWETKRRVRPTARRSDPSTSHEAARRADSDAPSLRYRCLLALQNAGETGLTDFELAAITGRQQTSVGVRRKELERAGFVMVLLDADGKPVRRPSPSGSPALVWRAA